MADNYRIDFNHSGATTVFTYLLFAIFGLLVFLIGYYFGNQMGRTEYIRDYLNKSSAQITE